MYHDELARRARTMEVPDLMRTTNLAQGWMGLVGLVLLAAGLVGFLNTPLAGSSPNALLQTDTVHNVVHLLTGLVALFIAFGLKGEQQVTAVTGFGVLYVIIFVAVLLSPTLFGLFSVSANAPIHVTHAAVAVVTLAVGIMARGDATQTAS
jgi:hypothetical protein